MCGHHSSCHGDYHTGCMVVTPAMPLYGRLHGSCMVATQEMYGSQINVPSTCEQLPHVSVLKHVIPIQNSNMIHMCKMYKIPM